MDHSSQPLTSTFINVSSMDTDHERLKQLGIHLKAKDYFATLATVMGFVEETIASADASNKELREREVTFIQDLKKDLLVLHKHYRIEPRQDTSFSQTEGGVVP